jgi:hypothetical protein
MPYIRGTSSLSTHRVSQYIDPGTIDSFVLRLQELHRLETIYNKNECLFSFKKMINYCHNPIFNHFNYYYFIY